MSHTPGKITQLVDRLLARHGVYRPLDLLVALRRLPETAQAEWHDHPETVLEDRLLGDPERWIELLDNAARWAERLGLGRDLKIPTATDGRPLRASRRLAWQQLLLTEYRRTDDGPQLDLFLDNPQTMARHRLVKALLSGKVQAAAGALDELSRIECDHTILTAAETLVDALGWPGDQLGNPNGALDYLEHHLQPAARRLLDRQADTFMRPLWRRMAGMLDAAHFDPAQPHLHPSWAARQTADWAAVIESIQAVAEYHSSPPLLSQLIEAGMMLGERALALGALAELCWQDSPSAERVLQTLTDPPVEALRDRFWDLEPPHEIAWFPTWLALHLNAPEPLHPIRNPKDDPPRLAYRTARALKQNPGNPEHRQALHRQCPILLAHWLAGRQRAGEHR